MAGFPPPESERWRLSSWQEAPTNRWSFSHLREVVATARVGRGGHPVWTLAPGPQADLGVPVTRADGSVTSVADVLAVSHTDGFIALRDGVVIAEQYPATLGPDSTHILMSVSKSLIGCVAGILIDRGLLHADAPLAQYVPEISASGYGGATVRDVLDMRSGIAFSETYLDPYAEVRVLEQVIGWAPRLSEGLPSSMYDYLATLHAQAPHGGAFDYRSCESDMLGWVLERASGVRMPELMSDVLWSQLGAEHDADAAVDGAGTVMHDGGIAASLRDLARFGQMLADDGVAGGRQVVPAWWIADSHSGGSDSHAAFAANPTTGWLPGGMYRNQFWIPAGDTPVLLGLGIHGQLLYVDTAHRFVGAKLSSWPYPQDPALLLDTLAATATLAADGSAPQ